MKTWNRGLARIAIVAGTSAVCASSALAQTASEGGTELLGYTTQAQFLVNCCITDVLAEANAQNALHYAPLAAEAQRLLSPAEMGELFKVMAVGTPDCAPLLGFISGDRRASL